MKITLTLLVIIGAFVAGLKAEELMEWRACRALAVFENGPPAWIAHAPPPHKPRPPAQLAAK